MTSATREMPDNFKIDKQVIDSLGISTAHKRILYKCLNESRPENIEKIALDILGEERKSNKFRIKRGMSEKTLGFLVQPPNNEPNNRGALFNSIKCEFYKFFCTDDTSYSNERTQVGKGIVNLIPLIAAAIAASIGIAVAIITGIVAALIMAMFKMGKNAWCNVNNNVCKR